MLSYAEDETEVEGTVNGITNTTTGMRCEGLPLACGLGWGGASSLPLLERGADGGLQTGG